MRLLLPLLFVLIAGPARPAVAQPAGLESEVFYHVFVRSFYDSDGDGHGDLAGIRTRLGYLDSLGVTGLLLTPLYDSEFYHNYFPVDFERIDAEYGTMDDYRALVEAAHARGMKVLMDMEVQYVAGDHPWFRDSYRRPGTPYSDYILYNDSANADPEFIFAGIEWLPVYDGRQFQIATLDLKHPSVRRYMHDLFRFWVDPDGDGDFRDGIDGFRLDHIMDDLDWKGKLTGLLAAFWKPLFDDARRLRPDLIFLGEQSNWDYGTDILVDGDADAVFAFPLSGAIAALDKQQIVAAMDSTLAVLPPGKYPFVFTENHDMDRLASRLGGDPGKLRAAAALTVLLKGVPLLYYGQEIGMRGQKQEWGHDGNDIPRREAFEWYAAVDGPGMALWYRDTGPWWDQTNLTPGDGLSLEEQQADPASLWHFYRRLIALRRTVPALGPGAFAFVPNDHPSVLSFERRAGDDAVVVLVNLSDQPAEARLDDAPAGPYGDLLSGAPCGLGSGQPVRLDPYQVQVCRAGE